MKIKSPVLLCLIICTAVSSVYAQISLKEAPFGVGETIRYEAKLTKSFIRGISLGGADITFKVTSAPNGKDYLFLTEAVSKGNLLRLVGYSFLEKYESTVDTENFRILRTVKHDEQGSRIRDSEAIFDYQQRQVIYTEIDPKDTARAPRRIAMTIPDKTLDIVSGLYSLRLTPLTVGKSVELTVSDSGFIYKIPVNITARELQNTILGKVWCYRLEPQVFGPRRLIEDDGKMIIWMTEDNRRIPVRAQIQAKIGKVEIRLKKYNK